MPFAGAKVYKFFDYTKFQSPFLLFSSVFFYIFVAEQVLYQPNKYMKKEKITIEHLLSSNSPSIIWDIVGTVHGWACWLADEVTQDQDEITFVWGKVWSHHEIRKAKLISCKNFNAIRIRWEDEEDLEAFVEIKMERTDLTGHYMLIITDFAEPNDMEQLENIWQDNLTRLHQATGL